MSQEPKNTPEENEEVLESSDDTSILAEPYQNKFGQMIPTSMVEEMEKSYLDYAMSVIVSRALPDVRDGLKPVHRRILYAMKGLNLNKKSSYKKCARIVGEVLGKYHPHGDTAVYDALVRLAQDFSMRYPLVDGQGNFGSIDGDNAAAMRYTEARMESITEALLADLDKETVPFVDNFDGSLQQPSVMPAKLPNLLLMGADGIAVGMATKIPPHNLGEVVDAAVKLIQKGTSTRGAEISPEKLKDEEYLETAEAIDLAGKFETEATIDDLLEHIKGPDFPTGGTMYDWASIKEVYTGGRGRVVVRAKSVIQEKKNGRFQIITTELPYQVNKARLVVKIADLVKNKKIVGISNLRDESDREGMRVVVELKKDARPKSVLNNLFKYTPLQDTFSANIVALNSDGAPQLMNLKTILSQYVSHRQLVVTKRTQYELRSNRARAHILEGLLIALDHLDEVIKIIRASADADTAKERLMTNFKLSQIQATAILDMQLRKLAALERKKIEDEYKAIRKTIEELVALLTDTGKILATIVTELSEMKDKYGDERRTKLVKSKIGEINEEDLIASEDNIIAVSETGYIKRMPLGTYRSQRRGGQGVSGMKTKAEDTLKTILTANTHDRLLIITNYGKVFKLPVYEIPESSRQAKGQAIINLISIEQGEEVKAIVPIAGKLEKAQDKFIFLVTKNGLVKKTSVKLFQNIRTSGIIAIMLKDGDEVVYGALTDGSHDIILVSNQGKSIRFDESQVRGTNRDTQGVKGINLKKDAFVVGAVTIDPNLKQPEDKRRRFFKDFLIVTENGIGKRTPIDQYPSQKRSGMGVKAANLSVKTGNIAAAQVVTQQDKEVVITTTGAQVIKLPLRNIPQLKRPTQGVILMRLSGKDKVASLATIQDQEEETPETTKV